MYSSSKEKVVLFCSCVLCVGLNNLSSYGVYLFMDVQMFDFRLLINLTPNAVAITGK